MGRALISALAEPLRVALRAYGRPSRWPSDGRDLADRRRAADDHLADRERHLSGRSARILDERVGQLPLVDQVEDAAILAERCPEPGRARRRRFGRRDRPRIRRRPRSQSGRSALGVQDRAGRLRRRLLERLRGARDRCRGVDQLDPERAKESPPTQVDGRVGSGRRRPRRLGRRGLTLWGRWFGRWGGRGIGQCLVSVDGGSEGVST